MKINVVVASPEDLEAALQQWLSQHPRAQIMNVSHTAAADGQGKIVVTTVFWYRE